MSRIGPAETTPLRADSTDNSGSLQHAPILRGGQGHDEEEQADRAFWFVVVLAVCAIGSLLAIAY